MGTALVYHEDMTAARLLWDDPECEIECPERLTTALERLQQRGLEQRCLQLAAREASEAELGLVHSPEYVALVRGTQALGTGELQTLSGQYDAVYFHPSTFHCSRLAVGAALQLVDAVLAGAVRNGLALVRPPGHHSQRAAANGFCVFNNVAIAARHAQRQHGLHRILIVDWDVHHGQGIQYIFEDDPSVLYFSWHRYEHGRFWPYLRESDADAVGQGPGLGFTVNLPWNQVGMGNADYVAAFLHVLLPVAFEFNPELVLVSAGFDSAIGDPEGQMQATPECFAHLTQLLQVLAGGRVCAVLEGGYHLESLSQSVCMMVQALLGDPAPPLSGPMVPHGSALESIQSVRVAQAPHWMSLQQQEGRPSSLLLTGRPEFKAATTQDVAALSSLLDQPRLNPTPPVRTAVALAAPDAALALPSDVLCEEGSAPQEETQAWARWAGWAWGEARDCVCTCVCVTHLWSVCRSVSSCPSGLSTTGHMRPWPRTGPSLHSGKSCTFWTGSWMGRWAVALQSPQPVLQLPPWMWPFGVACPTEPRGCFVWLWGSWIGPQISRMTGMTLRSRTTGGFLSCVLALVLPLAYSFQPDLVLVALGPAHGLRDPQAALLAALLRGPAGGRVLALVDEESTPQLVVVLARVLHGEAAPSLGPFSMASPEDVQALMQLRGQLEPRWKMLQVASEAGGPGSG
ncbi:polyamine deacetylase HDAC10 isoform X2 [Delphinus delphis]|uniref:polyamine deacetylase HDAC10 isoform X2 n=1 Tax=Delphinus delphis TaxID=9728 RepID=UPI0028C4F4D2|nr:polyamine deacetylase HDAC10 isoform X2 [Delphinus delphis]